MDTQAANTTAIDVAKSTPVAVMIERLGNEIRRSSTVVEDLEALIGNLMLAGAFGSSASLYQLQNLDRLRQELEGLAEFAASVSRLSPPAWALDAEAAVRSVRLSELSERLTAKAPAAHAVSADCELF